LLDSKGVLHGDVKPSNLLLDSTFHAKLCDLGAASAADGRTLTVVPVTMAYTCPEVLDDERATNGRTSTASGSFGAS
jgi:serine/threonine protein kinase